MQKHISVSVPANKSLTVNKNYNLGDSGTPNYVINSVTGTATSFLRIEADMTIDTVKNFGNVVTTPNPNLGSITTPTLTELQTQRNV